MHRVMEQIVQESQRVWHVWHFVFEEVLSHARGTPQDAVDVSCTPLDGAFEDPLVLVGQVAVRATPLARGVLEHVSQTSGSEDSLCLSVDNQTYRRQPSLLVP